MKKNDLFKAIFGEEFVKEKYKHVPHSFQRTVAGKSYCTNCGLLTLNNPFTNWAIDKGCLNELHPSYKSKLKLTNPLR